MSARRKPIGDHIARPFWSKADKAWIGKVVVGRKPDGTPLEKKVKRKTEREALEAVREIEKARDSRAKVYTAKNPTFDEWAQRWLNVLLPNNGVRLATIADYRSKMKCHVLPVLGTLRLSELEPEHFEDLYANIKRAGNSQSVIKGAHAATRSCLNYAVSQRTLGMSPLQGMRVASPVEKEIEAYSPTEAKAILAEAQKEPRDVRFALALALGPRQSEALGFRWPDLDLDTQTLWVRRGLRREPGMHGCTGTDGQPGGKSKETGKWPCGYVYGAYCPDRLAGGLKTQDTKTEVSKRPLPIPDELIPQVKAWKKEQARQRLIAGDFWEDGDWVFTDELGRPIDPRRDWGRWKELLRRAGVPEKRLHDARHTAATTLLVMGVDARVVMDIMGWSEAKTAKRYTHVVDVLRRDAATRIGKALWADEA